MLGVALRVHNRIRLEEPLAHLFAATVDRPSESATVTAQAGLSVAALTWPCTSETAPGACGMNIAEPPLVVPTSFSMSRSASAARISARRGPASTQQHAKEEKEEEAEEQQQVDSHCVTIISCITSAGEVPATPSLNSTTLSVCTQQAASVRLRKDDAKKGAAVHL